MGACCGKQAGADGGLGSASSAPPTIPQRKPQPAAEANNLRRNTSQRKETWKRTGMVSVRDANLKELPKEALELGAMVKTLDATNNAISALPTAIATFTQLGRLVMAQNRLTALPAEIGRLGSLRVLDLRGNALRTLPEELGGLVKLEKLLLAQNELRELFTSVGQLTTLRELDVSHNLLKALPAAVGRCTALQSLRASNNAISELPAELGGLVGVREILLDVNDVTTVPAAVFLSCESLQTLSLHGNPVNEDMLVHVEGFSTFRERVRAKHNKQIGGGVLVGNKGLDDGLDHTTTRIIVPHT